LNRSHESEVAAKEFAEMEIQAHVSADQPSMEDFGLPEEESVVIESKFASLRKQRTILQNLESVNKERQIVQDYINNEEAAEYEAYLER